MAHIAPAEAGDAGFADVSDDAGSAVPPLPPIPPAPKASKFCPRITWTTLHVVGLGLLHLSGMWSPQLLSVSMLDAVTILALLTLLFYIAASIIDPGYLPTGEQQAKMMPAEQASEQFAALGVPLVELPSCMHCQARQGARAKHCHDCGRCVRRLDHHCWWLGTCVGAGNHRLFVSYLFCEAALLCAAGGEASAGLMMDDTARARRAPIPAIASASAVGCLGMCATLGLLALTLLAFQLSLIARGETTWEHLRRERINLAANLPPHVRPYDRGVWRNLVYFACGGPLPPPASGAGVVPIATYSVIGKCTSCTRAPGDSTSGLPASIAAAAEGTRAAPAQGPPYGL